MIDLKGELRGCMACEVHAASVLQLIFLQKSKIKDVWDAWGMKLLANKFHIQGMKVLLLADKVHNYYKQKPQHK